MTTPDIQVGPGEDAIYTLELAVSGPDVMGAIAELGEFVARSANIQGAVINGSANHDNSAFTGGDKGGYKTDMATILATCNTPDAIRGATLLTVPETRLAEIADTYTLPDYLLKPDNEIDAAVAYVIKKMIGYTEDVSKSFQDEADESTEPVATMPEATPVQRQAFLLQGEINSENASQNSIYRPEQLETMDHVLRFFIIRDLRRLGGDGRVYMTTDYDFATGALGDALKVVNGMSEFTPDYCDETAEGLSRGLLPQRINITIHNGIVSIGTLGTREREPIWPQEAVEKYREDQVLKEKQRLANIEAEQLRYAGAKAAKEGERTAELAEWQESVLAAMLVAEVDGFHWLGIYSGNIAKDPAELEAYVRERHECSDVMIIPKCAIYGGKQVSLSSTECTVYIR
jgi:hypothetical protein